MLKPFAAMILIAQASPASAQDCPDFYRFVDFGMTDSAGISYRGGPLFRAESFGEEPLLLPDLTECRAVSPTATDGRGNPIPVVARIGYDPAKTGIDLIALGLALAPDAATAAEQAAAAHRDSVAAAGTQITRGDAFLCAHPSTGTGTGFSCQLVSPYPGNAALVVYCDAGVCRMPALAITDQLVVDAAWATDQNAGLQPDSAGPDAIDKILKIKDFLEPLSSAL